jgi:hypothetical protein
VTCRSDHTFVVDSCLVDESSAAAATESKELLRCVNWQYHIGQCDSVFQEGMVHRNL